MNLFTITFTDDEEILRIHQPGCPSYEKQPLGTWLLAILNADIGRLEAIVKKYELPNDPKSVCITRDGHPIFTSDPSNIVEVYRELNKQFPFTRAYSVSEWWPIYCEMISTYGSRCLRDAIDDLKQVIEITADHPEYLNYRFLSKYLLNGALNTNTTFRLQIYESGWALSYEECKELDEMSIEESMAKTYSCFLDKKDHVAPLRYEYSDISPRLEGIMFATFFELARRNKVVRKCKNCGRYFIPENRSDTLYCDEPSPEAPEMTCKEYGTRRLWYERQKEDELATLSRKIASAKGMLAKRNPDIPAYAASYEYFKAERMIWKKAVDEGRKTKEEYREWLLLMQSQKVIKEAVSNPG